MAIRSLSLSSVLLSALLLSACKTGTEKPNSTDNRVVEWELSDFEGLNPLNSSDANATYAEEQIFERLLACNPKTLEYNVPWIAESMPVISADHLQYDFQLRKDIKWADGKPLTGDDVIFSLKCLKNPFNALSAQKRVYVDPIHSAELVGGDPFHVRFILSKPYFLIKQATFGDALYIIPKHIFDPKNMTDKYSWDDLAAIIEHSGATTIDSSALAKHKNPAMQDFATFFTASEMNRSPKYIQGSGPYKLDEWKTQDHVRLVRNPYYVNHWGPQGEAFADTLLYKTILDLASATTALKSREVDVLGAIQPQYWVSIDTNNNSGLKRSAFTIGQFVFVGFNNKSPIFRDPGVRWAMAHMIDRKLIIQKLLFGMAKLTQSAVPSSHPEYNHDLPEIQFDPARAAQILDSLDWKDHDGDGIRDKVIDGKRVPFKFTFTVNSGNETRRKVLLIFAEALRKIGVQADITAIDWSVYLQRLRDHQIDAHLGGWVDDPYENDMFQLYHSSQAKNRGSNYDNYNSPRADHIMEQIRTEFDDAKRQQLQKDIQRVMYEDQANLFLWEPLNCAAWIDRFDNVEFFPYHPGYDISTWRIRGAGGNIKAAAF